MATTTARDLYLAANAAVLAILSDPVIEKSFQGRRYTLQNITELKAIRDALKLEAQAAGEIPADVLSSKVGVAQMRLVDV
jgi:hypothetical protein